MLFRFWVFPDCTFLDISISCCSGNPNLNKKLVIRQDIVLSDSRKHYIWCLRVSVCLGWRSHVHRTLTAQRVQSFKLQSANVGGRGALPSRSLGGPRGPFSHVREWPPYLRTLRHAGNKVQSTALPKIFCLSAKKKERLFRGVLLIFAKVKFTDTSACRRWQGRGHRRRRW